MYKRKRTAVVIPAYNEEKFIAQVVETIPHFVDRIYVVDDASTDDTYKVVSEITSRNDKLTIIKHRKNGGVGASIISGYKRAWADEMDVAAIMAGDGQMDPQILDKILDPVVEGEADYAKGNRLAIPQHRKGMSAWRTFGNFLLTYLTRIASGYWHIADPQDGYTAISRHSLQRIDLDKLEKGFAFENDILVKLNVVGARVVDVSHPAKYSAERSKIRYPQFIVSTSWLLFKDFLWRLRLKYIKRPFAKISGANDA